MKVETLNGKSVSFISEIALDMFRLGAIDALLTTNIRSGLCIRLGKYHTISFGIDEIGQETEVTVTLDGFDIIGLLKESILSGDKMKTFKEKLNILCELSAELNTDLVMARCREDENIVCDIIKEIQLKEALLVAKQLLPLLENVVTGRY